MSLRNRSSKNNSEFNLDNYLEEKSTESYTTDAPDQREEKKPSNLFRNASLIVFAALASVLWYYDWNPREAIAGVFGGSEPEYVILENPSADGAVIVIPPNSNSENLINLETQAAEAARAAEIALAEINSAEIINSEEIERLTEQSIAIALDAALAALEGLGNLDLEGLENLESLEALEGLEGLENFEVTINEAALEALENIDFSNIQIQTGSTNSPDFDQFSREMAALNINQFDNESIRNMHEAGIPISFLSKLDQAGLLDRLNADEIIQIFQEE